MTRYLTTGAMLLCLNAVTLPAVAQGMAEDVTCADFAAMDHTAQMAAVDHAMSGDAMSGSMSGDAMPSDGAASGGAMTSDGAMADGAMSGDAMSGDAMSGDDALASAMEHCEGHPDRMLTEAMGQM